VLWGNSNKQAPSCAFIKGVEIHVGEKVNWEIIILSPESIDKEVKVGGNIFYWKFWDKTLRF